MLVWLISLPMVLSFRLTGYDPSDLAYSPVSVTRVLAMLRLSSTTGHAAFRRPSGRREGLESTDPPARLGGPSWPCTPPPAHRSPGRSRVAASSPSPGPEGPP